MSCIVKVIPDDKENGTWVTCQIIKHLLSHENVRKKNLQYSHDTGEVIMEFEVTEPRLRRTKNEANKFQETVTKLYQEEHLKQSEIAKRMGCSRAYVSRIINGW